MVPLGVDWTPVLVAIIATVPATVGAVIAGMNHFHLRTPSRQSIGKQVEAQHHVARALFYTQEVILQRLGAERPASALAEMERAKTVVQEIVEWP